MGGDFNADPWTSVLRLLDEVMAEEAPAPFPAAPVQPWELDKTIDPQVVIVACTGAPVRLNYAERAQAVRILAATGRSDELISNRLRCSPLTVLTIRQDYGILSRVTS